MTSLWYLADLFAFLLLFSNVSPASGQQMTMATDDQWIAQPDFENMLPATLAPIFETSTATVGECLLYCQMKNCSSVGYSALWRSCKLFYHPTLKKPLPTLRPDLVYQHKMYYKKYYCPYQWEADYQSRMCYYIADGAPNTVMRPAAWSVCEANMMSNLVTFQTPQQRANLYSILQAKYASTTKWWTGYAMFDSNLWARPVEDFPGYVKRRGDCGGNDLISCTPMSPTECMLLCDRKFRDKCVAFNYNRQSSWCCLKQNSCDNPGTTNPVNQDWWYYEKVHAGRPASLTLGDCGGNDIRQLVDVSRDQCAKYCRETPHCVTWSYHTDRNCWLKTRSCMNKANFGNAFYEMHDLKDINPGTCPYGVRYRDVCLTVHRTSGHFYDLAKYCRQMGGKMISPVEKQKNAMYFAARQTWGWNYWMDYIDDCHESNWTSTDSSVTFSSFSVYQNWTFNSGEPNGGTNENCGCASTAINTASGVGYTINDGQCVNGNAQTICETPISLSWPQTCQFTPPGREFFGAVSQTQSGMQCKPWSQIGAYGNVNANSDMSCGPKKWQLFPEWYTDHAFCRNPDPTVMANSTWCYRLDNGQPEACSVPMCPETDWATGQTYTNPQAPYAAITYNAAVPDQYDWTVESVSGTANPICSLSMDDWCPNYYRGSCYKVFQTHMNRQYASNACKQNGWYLASITSMDEMHYLLGLILSLGRMYLYSDLYHIGLTGNSASTYTWESGEPYVNNYWQSGQPNGGSENCTFLWASSSGYMADYQCTYYSWFICEINLAS